MPYPKVLHVDVSIIVVCARHCFDSLTRFVVVCGESVDPFRICVGQFCTEVAFAGKEQGESVTTIIPGEQHVYNCTCEGLDLTDDARTSLIKHEHDGFAYSCKSLSPVQSGVVRG